MNNSIVIIFIVMKRYKVEDFYLLLIFIYIIISYIYIYIYIMNNCPIIILNCFIF